MRRNLPARREEQGLSFWNEPDLFGGAGFGGSPWQMMRRMQEDMDRMFGRFFGPSGVEGGGLEGGELARMGQQWAPSVDVSQTNGEWCIEADLPGVDKDNIDVEVRDGHLILRAEMRQEEQPRGEGDGDRRYQRRERRYGYFERVLPLPENADEEGIRCDFRNGVLTLRIPKTQEARQQGRRIPIADGGAQRAMSGAGAQRGTGAQGAAAPDRREPGMPQGRMEEEEERELAGAKGGEAGTRRRGKKS